MIKKLIDNIWEITLSPNDLEEFSLWSTSLHQGNLSFKINGNLHRFNSLQELAAFIYGMKLLNNLVAEMTLEKYKEVQQAKLNKIDLLLKTKAQEIADELLKLTV